MERRRDQRIVRPKKQGEGEKPTNAQFEEARARTRATLAAIITEPEDLFKVDVSDLPADLLAALHEPIELGTDMPPIPSRERQEQLRTEAKVKSRKKLEK